jgi:thymidine kinase
VGVRVVLAGLDLDYLGEPFGPVPRLLAVADIVSKVTAVCMKCGADATRSQRLVAAPEQVLVGAKDTYEARCRGCWSPHHG